MGTIIRDDATGKILRSSDGNVLEWESDLTYGWNYDENLLPFKDGQSMQYGSGVTGAVPLYTPSELNLGRKSLLFDAAVQGDSFWMASSNSALMSAFNSQNFTYSAFVNISDQGNTLQIFGQVRTEFSPGSSGLFHAQCYGNMYTDVGMLTATAGFLKVEGPPIPGQGLKMVTATYNNALKTLSLYIDASLVGTDTHNTDNGKFTNAGVFFQNCEYPNDSEIKYGTVECVRVYPYALSQEKIQYMFDTKGFLI